MKSKFPLSLILVQHIIFTSKNINIFCTHDVFWAALVDSKTIFSNIFNIPQCFSYRTMFSQQPLVQQIYNLIFSTLVFFWHEACY